MKIQEKNILFAVTFMIFLHVLIFGQSSAVYDLSHNVMAGGGEKSTNALYKLEGTIGQPAAGIVSNGTDAATNISYSLRGGFWAFEALAPTAATVTLRGQVFSGKGAGVIKRGRVVLTDTFTGAKRVAQTNPLGYYSFEGLEVGRFYIVQAESLNFTFVPASYAFVLMEERSDVNFEGERVQ